MLKGNPGYRHRLFRILPPIIDSLILISGVTLMVLLHLNTENAPWLTVKLIALVVYIVLGIIALNRVNNYHIQATSFVAAVLTILFMASVAVTHNPYGVFAQLFN